jgi:hypothetical protein
MFWKLAASDEEETRVNSNSKIDIPSIKINHDNSENASQQFY